jgi:hypothetical protein
MLDCRFLRDDLERRRDPMRLLILGALGLGVAGVLAACSGDDTTAAPKTSDAGADTTAPPVDSGGGDTAPVGPAPTIKITSPADQAAIIITDDPDVQIAFTVTNFTLMDPGSCGATKNCGHVQILVDGPACNDNSEDSGTKAFNAEGSTSPIGAGLDYCPGGVNGIPGPHAIVAELHNDDESPVKNAAGATISDIINITATVVTDAGPDAPTDADAGTDAPADAPSDG